MGSDRARVTYDPKQQYRSVVMQQGRVTLEADWNEAQQIAGEELRKETLDFVGPCGTPDDGYKVLLPSSPMTPYDFTIGSGTMYVGGIRAYLFNPIDYAYQPDWRDYGPEDPNWVNISGFAGSPSNPPVNEFVYLLLREQEISAVEDPDLKDVALGGPDTAQRTRLLQRFPRVASQGTDCVSGLMAAQNKWQTEGLFFDPNTMRLTSWSRLMVGFSTQGQNQSLCQPQAQGGYLDPDNQLIRVQISGIDPASGNPKFLWGFDDASFLYRVDVDPNAAQNLIFQSVPVDSAHQPVSGQAVEVLRTAADLPNGADVAAASGFVFTLDQNYDPDSQSIVIPSAVSLPADYTTPVQSPPNQLFLRVWQQEIVFTPGTAVNLGDTGVQVTLTLQSPGSAFHLGDFWMFAVRPATPQTVYPERYQQAPQRADGPRLWACPLGVISWSQQVGTLTSDCRNQFCKLVDACKRQQGCCTITVRPQDLNNITTLQTIVNQASSPTMLVQAANSGAPGNNISVQISNLNLSVSPPTFDLTVIETDVYLGLTVAQSSTGIEGIIGDEEGGPNDGLAHILVGSVKTQLEPLNNQSVTFSGGDANTNAQANIMDSANQQAVFILQARNPGTDGNLMVADIFSVPGSPATFNLSITWQKTLPGLNMGTLFPAIQASLGYEIVATPPTTAAPAFPSEGTTNLSGGAEPDPSTGANATFAQALIFGNPAIVCLRPGSYSLNNPLVLGPEQSNITIEACAGATLSAGGPANELKGFLHGLIQLNGANNVTLSGLTFAMPSIVLYQQGSTLAGVTPAAMESIGEAPLIRLQSSVGLTLSGCNAITVENCQFRFPSLQLEEVFFGAAIFAGADCSGITLMENFFDGPAAVKAVVTSGATVPDYALAAGYLQADSLQAVTLGGGSVNGGTLIPSTLDNLVVSDNSFENLAFPLMIITALGAATFERNVMRSCLSGFTILPLIASLSPTLQIAAGDVRSQVLNNPSAQRMFSIALTYPRPATFVARRQINLVAAKPPAIAPKAPALAANRAVPASVRTQIAATPILNRPITAVRTIPLPPAAAVPASGLKVQSFSPFTARVAQFMIAIAVAPDFSITQFNFNALNFSVQFSGNDIDAFVFGGGSLWALLIVDLAAIIRAAGGSPGPNTETTLGTLTLTSNRLRSLSSSFYTSSMMVDFSAVTGNTILNRPLERGRSLQINVPDLKQINIAEAAVTGNVLIGTTDLPPRTPATLPDWTTYNYTR